LEPLRKKRIHELARELDVTSKAIIERCAQDGIRIQNHMHIVSAGLEAAVRKWFEDESDDFGQPYPPRWQ